MLSEDSSVVVARIYKQWRGLCAEALTDADSFGLSFPLDMEVRTKTLLLGALFLIVSYFILTPYFLSNIIPYILHYVIDLM